MSDCGPAVVNECEKRIGRPSRADLTKKLCVAASDDGASVWMRGRRWSLVWDGKRGRRALAGHRATTSTTICRRMD